MDNTLPLQFDEKPEADKPRSKRLRRRKVKLATGTAFQQKPQALPVLLKAPQEHRCGFCGNREMIEGDAALCSRCGSVILREE